MNFARYKAGIYVRLSREDENKDLNQKFSESIENQKDFLTDYAIKNGYSIIDYYADDGISGTTFEREEFERMLKDIEEGRINMVLTKDLSRLGRDYIQTGYYLEKYFPLKNVRYIAVNDNYDSMEEDSGNEMAPFKSVFNDMYAKDISKKVRTALKTKQIKGEYLGTNAPLGYKKDISHKGKLIIDEVSSKYVKEIFNLYLSGKSILEISNILMKEKVPTPSEYAKKMNNTQKYFKGAWNDKSVRFILHNEVYIGNTVQNKKKNINYKIKKQVEIPKEEWIKVKNTHEPIISLEDFELVQQKLNKNGYKHSSNKKSKHINHLLSGLIFCENCKAPMTFIPAYKKHYYYICCSTVKRYKKNLGLCKSNLIKEKEVEGNLITLLKYIFSKYINNVVVEEKLNKFSFDKLIKENEQEFNKLEENLSQIKKIRFNLYKDKTSELITEKEFLNFMKQTEEEEKDINLKINNIKLELNKIKEKKADTAIVKKLVDKFIKLDFEKGVDRNTLVQFIDKITFSLDGGMTVYFTFKKPERRTNRNALIFFLYFKFVLCVSQICSCAKFMK